MLLSAEERTLNPAVGLREILPVLIGNLSRFRRELALPDPRAVPFAGLTHKEALAREIPAARELVKDLVEAGTVGMIAGLPYTGKSYLGLEFALKVAAGGRVLGIADVLKTGPVGYWWQDDSEANELARLQDYSRRHDFPADLPIHWHLNEGLRLPENMIELRWEIELSGQVLVVLDSLYNFLPGLDLKDEGVAGVIADLKREICDPTGCAICLIDHAPWPSEGNRGQRRGYGSVFKAAAVRWSIHLERSQDGSGTYVEARGNNTKGLARSLFVWDAERLEMRRVETRPENEEAVDSAVDAFLLKRPGSLGKEVEEGVRYGHEKVRESLKRGATSGRHLFVTGKAARTLGRDPRGKYWYPAGHKDLTSPGEIGATTGEMSPGENKKPMSPTSAPPRRGGGVRGDIDSPVAKADGSVVQKALEILDGDPSSLRLHGAGSVPP